MNEPLLRPLAGAMFAAAGGVLGSLANVEARPGPVGVDEESGSVRTGGDEVATLTRIPAAGLSFVTRYREREVVALVGMMLGTSPEDGELDAMQRSIVAETVAQVSSAMAEALASELGVSALDTASETPADAASFPPPPFAALRAVFELGEGVALPVTLLFDGVAQHVLDASAAPPSPAAAPPPAPAPAPRRVREDEPAVATRAAQFAPLAANPARVAPPGQANLELVHDVPLEIAAVLGQTELSLREVVSMQPGSVFELDKASTDPVDLYVNDILIARGEVVVVDDKFAVKISELNPVVDAL